MRLQRVEYDVHLAQRQYLHVDPENRLVAAELERRWEQQLHQLHALEQEIAGYRARAVQPAALTPELRAQFAHISARLPELWYQLAPAQQCFLLCSLVETVVMVEGMLQRQGRVCSVVGPQVRTVVTVRMTGSRTLSEHRDWQLLAPLMQDSNSLPEQSHTWAFLSYAPLFRVYYRSD